MSSSVELYPLISGTEADALWTAYEARRAASRDPIDLSLLVKDVLKTTNGEKRSDGYRYLRDRMNGGTATPSRRTAPLPPPPRHSWRNQKPQPAFPAGALILAISLLGGLLLVGAVLLFRS